MNTARPTVSGVDHCCCAPSQTAKLFGLILDGVPSRLGRHPEDICREIVVTVFKFSSNILFGGILPVEVKVVVYGASIFPIQPFKNIFVHSHVMAVNVACIINQDNVSLILICTQNRNFIINTIP